MKPFKLSMEKGDGMELYGQGETLTLAIVNLIRAVDQYGDAADRRNIVDALAELRDGDAGHPALTSARLALGLPARCPCGDMTVDDCAGECGRP